MYNSGDIKCSHGLTLQIFSVSGVLHRCYAAAQ